MSETDALLKANRINMLFDFYEPLLTDKQQMFLKYYFHDDYSLGEIASQFNISRQAVYEHIKRSEAVLEDYEAKLKLAERYQARGQCLDQLEQLLAEPGTMVDRERLAPIARQLRAIEQAR